MINFCVDKLQGRLTDGLCSICMTIMLISYADRSTGVLQESVSICFSVRHQLPLICLKSTLLSQSWDLRLRCTYPLIHSQNAGVTLFPGAVCPCTQPLHKHLWTHSGIFSESWCVFGKNHHAVLNFLFALKTFPGMTLAPLSSWLRVMLWCTLWPVPCLRAVCIRSTAMPAPPIGLHIYVLRRCPPWSASFHCWF